MTLSKTDPCHSQSFAMLSPSVSLCYKIVGVHLNKWTLDRRLGLACLMMYAVFLCFSILIEFNIFTFVNLPTCRDGGIWRCSFLCPLPVILFLTVSVRNTPEPAGRDLFSLFEPFINLVIYWSLDYSLCRWQWCNTDECPVPSCFLFYFEGGHLFEKKQKNYLWYKREWQKAPRTGKRHKRKIFLMTTAWFDVNRGKNFDPDCIRKLILSSILQCDLCRFWAAKWLDNEGFFLFCR